MFQGCVTFKSHNKNTFRLAFKGKLLVLELAKRAFKSMLIHIWGILGDQKRKREIINTFGTGPSEQGKFQPVRDTEKLSRRSVTLKSYSGRSVTLKSYSGRSVTLKSLGSTVLDYIHRLEYGLPWKNYWILMVKIKILRCWNWITWKRSNEINHYFIFLS